MSGALISLVSRGAQDVYLTSETGTSFFRTKYSRHTNFAQSPKLMTLIGSPNVSGGTTVIPLDSYGDLINGV